MLRVVLVAVVAGTLAAPAAAGTFAAPTVAAAPAPARAAEAAGLPRPDHVVVVMEENRSYARVIGPAPYLTSLAGDGARFTASYAVTHPSEPNYLALFSGSTQGVTSDTCRFRTGADNLGRQLIDAGLSFTGYSESLPALGYTGCSSGAYVRRHSPWVLFTNLPSSGNVPFSDFPADFAALPTVSFVTPGLDHDMHDGSVGAGDAWLRAHLDRYVRWAGTHNSLLIVTFDEDDHSAGNQIPTVFAGAMVRAGSYAQPITHYSVLRTLEDMYDLPCLGAACGVAPIIGVWR